MNETREMLLERLLRRRQKYGESGTPMSLEELSEEQQILSAPPAPSQSARELWATLCNGKPNTKDWHHIGDKFTDIEAAVLIGKHDRDERELVIEECKTRLKSKVANDNCLTLDDIETVLDALKGGTE